MNAAAQTARAWVALTVALAVHVADEALNGFLSVYNPVVLNLRSHIPWLPLPVFRFDLWLAGLIGAVIALLCLPCIIATESKWMARASVLFAVLMIANGMMHFAGSAFFGRWMPGVYSSPLLLVSAAWLLASALRQLREPTLTVKVKRHVAVSF